MSSDAPSRSERRHRHLHRVAFDKLAADPKLRTDCLLLVGRWLADPAQAHARPWLETWRRMLADWTIDRMRAAVLDPDEGQTLRRCSPLAPVLSPQERWAALAEVDADVENPRDHGTR